MKGMGHIRALLTMLSSFCLIPMLGIIWPLKYCWMCPTSVHLWGSRTGPSHCRTWTTLHHWKREWNNWPCWQKITPGGQLWALSTVGENTFPAQRNWVEENFQKCSAKSGKMREWGRMKMKSVFYCQYPERKAPSNGKPYWLVSLQSPCWHFLVMIFFITRVFTF